MAKWADYGISAVRYDKERKHIQKVKVHEDNGDTFGQPSEETRSAVVSSIESGKTYVTILTSTDKKWTKGEDVHIVTIEKKKYLRTDANETEEDNLGELPEFKSTDSTPIDKSRFRGVF